MVEAEKSKNPNKEEEKREFFTKVMMRLQLGELAMGGEEAWRLTKKVYRKGLPVRELPKLGDVYMMRRRELLRILT